MSTHVVAALPKDINFAPASVVEEVLQNVRMIISTPKYSVPLDRAIGVTATYLDAPMPAASAQLIAELIEAIPAYEPRARVQGVTFTGDGLLGRLAPQVEVTIND